MGENRRTMKKGPTDYYGEPLPNSPVRTRKFRVLPRVFGWLTQQGLVMIEVGCI